jgi:hypothetical protein
VKERDIELRRFLTAYYPDALPAGVTILVRGVPVDGSAPRTEHYASIDVLLADRERLDRWNAEGCSIFFSPTLRDGRNGDKYHCIALPALWAESDAKEFFPHKGDAALIRIGQDAIDATLKTFGGPRPSIIVNSGGGKQFHWLLKDTALRRDGKGKRAEWQAFMQDVEATLTAMQPALHSDPARLNFDSLLRLPTFSNPKYAHKPVAATVTFEPELRYTLGDFEKYTPAVSAAPAERDSSDPEEHALLRAFKERDLYIRWDGGDKHLVVCPWNAEHESKGSETKTVLFDDGERITGFKCLGAHCANRRLPDVLKFFGIEDEVQHVEIVEVKAEGEAYLLPMPAAARQGLIHDYASMYAQAYGTDYNLWYSAYLAFFAASVSMLVRLNSFSRRPLRQYALMIGSKNTGKSQSRDITRDFFRGIWEQHKLPESTYVKPIYNANSDQGLIASMTSENATERALMLMPDEFAQVLKKCSIQNSTLGQMLTELYEKENTDTWTKDNRKHASPDLRVHLSILGGLTPIDFTAHFDALTALGGLLSRMWLVAAGSPPTNRRRVVAPDQRRLDDIRIRTRNAIQHAVLVGGIGGAVNSSPAADAVLDRWAAANDSALGTEIGTRMVDHVEKVAALMALIRTADNHAPGGTMLISELDMEIGTELGTWELDVRRMFQVDPADTRVAKYAMQVRRALARLIGKKPYGAVRDDDLRDTLHDYRWTPGVYDHVMENLEKAGEVERLKMERVRATGPQPVAWKVGYRGLRGVAA